MPFFRRFVFFLAVSYSNPAWCQIRVRLIDYAGVSPTTLNKAEAFAVETLAAAGVELSWTSCSADPGASVDSRCHLPLTANDLQLRIIDKTMAKRTRTSRFCLGYAILGAEFPSIASVFYHRALDLEKGYLAHRSSILGAMMAHEIGHLLLAEHSHPARGIMRGVWDDQDLKTIAKGRMWFSQDEAARMASATALRRVTSDGITDRR